MADHVFGPANTVAYDERSASILRALKNNMASFLAAITSASSVPSEADRQALHDYSSETSLGDALPDFPMSTFGVTPGSRDNFEFFAGIGLGDFNTSAGDEAWMSWPPAQIYP